MRIAIIDLGTNSVRFDVHQLGPGRLVRTLHREKIMIRLGQGVFTQGQLDPDAIERTVHAFHSFKKIAEELRVNRMLALATSALREAGDSARLVAKVRASTKIDVRVITGPEEAHLIALGILSNEQIPKGKTALVDIGGGSTEITVTQARKILYSESFPLGTARLQQVFLKKSPPSHDSVDQMRAYIRKFVVVKMSEGKWPRVGSAIGSSGTIRALTKIVRKNSGKKVLKLKDLSVLVKRMRRMNTTQLLGIQGMESKRVDMILAGAVLLEECMLALRIEQIAETEFSLRDGILEEQIELAKKHLTSRIGLHLDDLIGKAETFGGNRKHLLAVVSMTEALFRSLSKLHKLDRDWRLYLDAAAILRNVGEAVSIIGNQQHSYYIVKNARFPFIEDWESEFVASLCLYHERHKINFKDVPFEKMKTRRQAFLKCLAMLWVIDALDADPKSAVVIKRVSVTKTAVRISFSGGTSTDLEIFRVEPRKAFFSSIFKRSLEVVRV